MCHVVVRTDRLFKWIRVRLGFITVARPTGKRKNSQYAWTRVRRTLLF